jgi:hypothetical protein
MQEAIAQSQVAKVSVVNTPYHILRVYDEKLASEAASHPALRKCPHRAHFFKRCINASLASTGGNIRKGDLYLILDQGKQKQESIITKTFQDTSSVHHHYLLQHGRSPWRRGPGICRASATGWSDRSSGSSST